MADEDVDIEEALKGYQQEYLECRDLRHAWRVAGWFRGRDGMTNRVLRCLRCETERRDAWTYFGGMQRSYSYPEGYRLGAKADVATVRAEELRRVINVYSSEESLLEALRLMREPKKKDVVDVREKKRVRAVS